MSSNLDALGPTFHDAAYDRVAAAIAAHPTVPLTWAYSSRRPTQPLTVPDLVAAFLEIKKGSVVKVKTGTWQRTRRNTKGRKVVKKGSYTGMREVGFTRRRMGRALNVPAMKAAAMMKTLLALKLIEVVKNHSAGRRGIVYATVPEDRAPRPDPDARRTIDPDDDPFDALEVEAVQHPVTRDVFISVPRDGSNIVDDDTSSLP